MCSLSCDGGLCPPETACATAPNSSLRLACYPTQCAPGEDRHPCSFGGAYTGQCCASVCQNTNTDDNNCGQCGRRCGANQECRWGECEARVDCTTAPVNIGCRIPGGADGLCCGGQCVALDVRSDRESCGGCGQHCPLGEVCAGGHCYKPDGGYSSGCFARPSSCAPGLACDGDTQRCVTDTCTPSNAGAPCSGPGRSTCCGSNCVNFDTDSNNCGACGNACGAGRFCYYGTCRATPTCGPPNSGVDCPLLDGGGLGQCCGSACVDPKSSAINCGACGVQCPSGRSCTAGICTIPDGGHQLCNDTPGACPPGTRCDGYTCKPLTCPIGSTGETCLFGVGVGWTALQTVTGRCCNGLCSDLNQDPRNCTACGTSCSSGLCIAGNEYGGPGSMCYLPVSTNCRVTCPSDTFCAGGRCVPRTCGAASVAFPGGSCITSMNQAGTCCPQGFGSGPACVNPQNDAANCGGCGIDCGPGATCNNGVCSTIVAPCTGGHLGQFCNLDAGASHVCCPGGGCVDTSSDNRNCGRCGGACTTDLTCVNGACVALVCTAATPNRACPLDAGVFGNCCSSTCVNRRNDPSNCGSCGQICSSSETCVSGLCGLDVCDSTSLGSVCHRDAGLSISAGMCCAAGCVDSRSDRTNCGGCNRTCPGDAGCVNGNCR